MSDTEILWDAWGVPHIFAAQDSEAFRALGWAQTQAHGNLLLKLYLQARGRAAAIYGEAFLESDRFVHRMGIPERAVTWAAGQTPEMRLNLEAFVAGINAHAAAHPDSLEPQSRAALPVTLTDVFAHIQRVYAIYLTQNGQRPSGAVLNEIIPSSYLLPEAPVLGTGIAGSNAWAIGGAKTQSGRPILLANPHLQWADFFTFFEAHLNVAAGTSEALSLYGVAQVGWPVLRYGFNDHLGWAHTVNALKGWDAFALEIQGARYKLDGDWQPLESREVRLQIRQADGSTREETLEVQRSQHGPIIGQQDGHPIAARCVGFEVGSFAGIFEQYWQMARAQDFAAFQSALERHQNPMFTVMYADREGHIAHFFGGFVPRRKGGSWQDWSGTLPGDDSSLVWQAIHDFHELPHTVDPDTGWLQNANNPPWNTTLPALLNPDRFPAYFTSRLITPREQRSIRMVLSLADVTITSVMSQVGSTRSETADRLLPSLLEVAARSQDDLVRRAAEVLVRWDRSFEPDSVGADLFVRWLLTMRPADSRLSNLWAHGWQASDPTNTPSGLRNPEEALLALEVAAVSLLRDTGTLERRWGDFAFMQRGDFSAEAHGHLDPFGVFRASGYVRDESGLYRIAFGTTYVAITEFSDPVRARVLLSYGNSSQPGSKHVGDQLPMFAAKQMREALLVRSEIEANLERREMISG